MDTTEFALAETHEPHLFVVRKQQRSSQQAGEHRALAGHMGLRSSRPHDVQAERVEDLGTWNSYAGHISARFCAPSETVMSACIAAGSTVGREPTVI